MINKMVTLHQIRQALTALALPETVSSEEAIRQAFTSAVKAAADGYGGYTGDMNALTTAKEVLLIALANARELVHLRREQAMRDSMVRAGERLRAHLDPHLDPSGLFRAVRMQPGNNVVILSLDLNEPLVFSDRVMRFLINYLGEFASMDDRERTLGVWCGAIVEEVTERKCRIRIRCKHLVGWDALVVIAELIQLATRFSQSAVLPAADPHEREAYRPGGLLQVFQTKEALFTFYEHFVIRVIANHDDLAEPLCDRDPALRDLWLCCPKHRRLFAQRLMLNECLRHLLDTWLPDEEYAAFADQQYLDDHDHPSQEEMTQALTSLLEQELTPQTWFEAYLAHQSRLEQEHWTFPTRHCSRRAHIVLKCCAFHVALDCIERLFNTWLLHFDALYHMSQFVTERLYPIGLHSIYGLALFAHLAQVDLRTMPGSRLLKQVLEVDVTTFQRRETE